MRISHQLLLTTAICLTSSTGLSQGKGAASEEAQPASQAEDSGPEVQVAASPGGVRRYHLGKWSTLEVRGMNRGESDRHAVISVYFGDNQQVQYKRRLRIPAGTTRKTWLPVLAPDSLPAGEKKLRASFLKIIETESGEVLSRRDSDTLITDSYLPLADHHVQTAMIFDIPALTGEENPLDAEAYELVVAGRVMMTDDRMTIDLGDQFLPPYAHAYDGLDQLVICTDRILTDSACLPAIRGWIARGGHVWFMLDRVRPETVTSLLGNAVPFEVVDRVELTQFMLHTPSAEMRGENPVERWQSERAVDFVRVLVDSATMHSRIDDWPAAFSIPFGTGEVYFTTLGARGWRHQNDRFAEDRDNLPTSGDTAAFRAVMGEFYQPRHERLLANDALQPILETQIGYEVPSRGLAGLLLGVNFIAILGTGIWFAKRDKLETMAFVVPGIALVTTALFIGLGRANAVSVPASAAIFELVAVSSDTGEAFTDTVASVYSPDAVELQLRHDAYESVQPESSGDGGSRKLAVWGTMHQGSWDETTLAPGTARLVEASRGEAMSTPLESRGSFVESGFSGRLIGAHTIDGISDSVVAREPAPSMATQFTDNRFVCTEDSVLSAGEHLTGALLSDEQRRRQRVYRQLLDPEVSPAYPRIPTLLLWGQRKDTRLSLPDGFEINGSTLYSIPIAIERTPPGERFTVPSSFIRVQQGGGKFGASAVYNARTGKWSEKALLPTDSWFRFVIPRQVQPCKIEQALFSIKIHAPSRTLDVGAVSGGEKVSFETRENPSGVLEFSLQDPSVLQLQPDGSLILGVRVGATEAQVQREEELSQRAKAPLSPTGQSGDPKEELHHDNSTWQIDYMKLSVKGITL